MLERTSRFVLEVLPYLLSALIAAVVVPGFLYSQAHGTNGAVMTNVPDDSSSQNHRPGPWLVCPRSHALGRPSKMARDKLTNR